MASPSVADRYSATRSKEQFLYSDFLTNFNVHPDSKQFMTIKNEVAVTRSIKNLLLTKRVIQFPFSTNMKKAKNLKI